MTESPENQPEDERVPSEDAASREAEATSNTGAGEPAGGSGADADPVPTSERQTYVVQPGDSLSAISEKVYGDARHWTTIFEHNKDKIDDPDVIQPGQELVIP